MGVLQCGEIEVVVVWRGSRMGVAIEGAQGVGKGVSSVVVVAVVCMPTLMLTLSNRGIGIGVAVQLPLVGVAWGLHCPRHGADPSPWRWSLPLSIPGLQW